MLLIEKEKTVCEELYSFDIFDTLITRKTATPQGIFALMQEILMENEDFWDIPFYIRSNFYDYRIKCEQYKGIFNYHVNGYCDSSFEEIYQLLKQNYNIPENQVKKLMKLEIQTETDNLVPITDNINKIKKLINDKKRVILISDMYHSEKVIRSFLNKFDSIFENISIYVSNEYKKKKKDGSLYKEIAKIEGIDFSKWYHTGDNKISDYKSAIEQNINASLFNFPELKPYEKYAIKCNPTNAYPQQLIGCARLARLNCSNNLNCELGSSLGGPIIFSYIVWVLNESIKKGYKRLYFIARDGYMPKLVADMIISNLNLDIKTKYIYGSRLAWQKPSFYVSQQNLKDVILHYGVNSEILSKTLNISKNKLKKFASPYFDQNTNLDAENKLKLCNKLLQNSDFMQTLNIEKKDFDNLVGYLKQEIDFSDDNFTFVDTIGTGTTQNCLASVINTFYPKAINSFYLKNGSYRAKEKNVNRSYCLFGLERSSVFVELLTRAPHGQTLGYKYDNEEYLPILGSYDEKNWDFKNYVMGINTFVNTALSILEPLNFDINIILNYLNWMVYHIDKSTAIQLGSLQFDYAGKNELKEFAPEITFFIAIKYLLNLPNSDINKYTKMYKLSYIRSSKFVRKILDFKYKYSSLRKFLIHIHYASKKKECYLRFIGIKLSLRKLFWKDLNTQ